MVEADEKYYNSRIDEVLERSRVEKLEINVSFPEPWDENQTGLQQIQFTQDV